MKIAAEVHDDGAVVLRIDGYRHGVAPGPVVARACDALRQVLGAAQPDPLPPVADGVEHAVDDPPAPPDVPAGAQLVDVDEVADIGVRLVELIEDEGVDLVVAASRLGISRARARRLYEDGR